MSKMRPVDKRRHFTAILELAGKDYQDEYEGRRPLVPVINFLKEQQGSDEELMMAAEHRNTGFRVIIDEGL
jgi:hypothetical protein